MSRRRSRSDRAGISLPHIGYVPGDKVVDLNGKLGVVTEVVVSVGYFVRGRGCSAAIYQPDELQPAPGTPRQARGESSPGGSDS